MSDFTVRASTRLLVLLGDPVSHSLSPVIQNAALRAAGLDAVYVAQATPAEELGPVLRAQCFGGGGGNITVPHKEGAATLLDLPSDSVRRTGACNTFWSEEGRVAGDNTDLDGFRRSAREAFDGAVGGGRVLLCGAGGSARAVLAALMADEVGEVVLLNRTHERARAIARRIGGSRVRVADGAASLEGEAFDLVINATSLGRVSTDELPVDLDALGTVGGVFDLNYRPGGTPMVGAAADRGLPAVDGRSMLVHQGAIAFERWTGVDAPTEVMRTALNAALDGGGAD